MCHPAYALPGRLFGLSIRSFGNLRAGILGAGTRCQVRLATADKNVLRAMSLVEELRDALWEADDDTSVHCIILKSAGSSLCAGYDLMPNRVRKDDGVQRRKRSSMAEWGRRELVSGNTPLCTGGHGP